jgi:hypothetical protein
MREAARRNGQFHRRGIVFRNVQGAGPLVLNMLLRVGGDTRHEVVVQREAVDAEPQKRVDVPLDVRSENSCGCLRGAAAGPAHIDDSDGSAASRQCVSDGAPDDPAAHNRDLHHAIVPTRLSFAFLTRVGCLPTGLSRIRARTEAVNCPSAFHEEQCVNDAASPHLRVLRIEHRR